MSSSIASLLFGLRDAMAKTDYRSGASRKFQIGTNFLNNFFHARLVLGDDGLLGSRPGVVDDGERRRRGEQRSRDRYSADGTSGRTDQAVLRRGGPDGTGGVAGAEANDGGDRLRT